MDWNLVNEVLIVFLMVVYLLQHWFASDEYLRRTNFYARATFVISVFILLRLI